VPPAKAARSTLVAAPRGNVAVPAAIFIGEVDIPVVLSLSASPVQMMRPARGVHGARSPP